MDTCKWELEWIHNNDNCGRVKCTSIMNFFELLLNLPNFQECVYFPEGYNTDIGLTRPPATPSYSMHVNWSDLGTRLDIDCISARHDNINYRHNYI